MQYFHYKQHLRLGCGPAAIMHAAAELGYGVIHPHFLAHPDAEELYKRKFSHPINLVELMSAAQKDINHYTRANTCEFAQARVKYLQNLYQQPFTPATPAILKLWYLEHCFLTSTNRNDHNMSLPSGSWPSAIIRVVSAMGFKFDVGIINTHGRQVLETRYEYEIGSISQKLYPYLSCLASEPSALDGSALYLLGKNPIRIYENLPQICEHERLICLILDQHWIVCCPNNSFMDPGIGRNYISDSLPITMYIKIWR